MEQANNQQQQQQQQQQQKSQLSHKQARIQNKQLNGFQNENMTEEELEKKRQEIIASLKSPCSGCHLKESQQELRKTKFCNDCYCSRLFNKTLSYLKGKTPKIGEKLLVAIVGEVETDIIIDNQQKKVKRDILAKDFLNLQRVMTKARAPNKILNHVEILYLDMGNSVSTKRVENWGKMYDIQITKICISDIYNGDNQKLYDFLKLFKDQDEVLRILSYNLIMKKAKEMEFQHIFLSDCGQDMAKNTFALVTQGRGLGLLQEIRPITVVPYKGDQVTVYRILKDMVYSEIDIYQQIKGIDGIHHENQQQNQENQQQQEEEVKKNDEENNNNNENNNNSENVDLVKNRNNKKPTIENILDGFFDKLQISFPSTVHTAIRSLDKVRDKFEIQGNPCFMCLGKLDKIVNQLELDSYEDLGKSQVQGIQGLCFGCMRMIKNSNSDINTILTSLPQIIKDNQ